MVHPPLVRRGRAGCRRVAPDMGHDATCPEMSRGAVSVTGPGDERLEGDAHVRRAPALIRHLTMSFTVAPVSVHEMDAVAAVYDEVHAELFGYAASLTRDPSAAEDVVHEAFA